MEYTTAIPHQKCQTAHVIFTSPAWECQSNGAHAGDARTGMRGRGRKDGDARTGPREPTPPLPAMGRPMMPVSVSKAPCCKAELAGNHRRRKAQPQTTRTNHYQPHPSTHNHTVQCAYLGPTAQTRGTHGAIYTRFSLS